MITFILVFIAILAICILVGLFFIFQKLSNSNNTQQQEEQLQKLVHQALSLSSTQIAQQSKQILQGEKEIIQTDLNNKHQAIQKLVEQLKTEIDQRQVEIRELERDRNKTYASVREAITQHQEITKELKTTTEALSKVLSNNQQRGAWGERIIEDLLQSSGLIEGVHYLRQSKLGTTTDRPDITLLLPNKRVVPIDVKFPLSEMQKLAATDNKAERLAHEKQFGIDVRQKIRKVALYIKPEEDTLDYAILFVPNEMIFSYINQKYPDIITEAMQMRVMIVSPFTFLIVARTIMESYRNFMMESNLRTIVKYIGEFAKEWEMFVGEFDQFGQTIGKLDEKYRKIRDTRNKQMNRRIDQIQKLQVKESEQPVLIE